MYVQLVAHLERKLAVAQREANGLVSAEEHAGAVKRAQEAETRLASAMAQLVKRGFAGVLLGLLVVLTCDGTTATQKEAREQLRRHHEHLGTKTKHMQRLEVQRVASVVLVLHETHVE